MVHSRNFLSVAPPQSQAPSQVATHQEIGSQLWAGETLDSNPGLQDNSLNLFYLKFGQRTLAVCPPVVFVDCDEGIPALGAAFKKTHIKTGLK